MRRQATHVSVSANTVPAMSRPDPRADRAAEPQASLVVMRTNEQGGDGVAVGCLTSGGASVNELTHTASGTSAGRNHRRRVITWRAEADGKPETPAPRLSIGFRADARMPRSLRVPPRRAKSRQVVNCT